MKQIIVIHGAPEKEVFFDPATPSPSNSQWYPWLQKQIGLSGDICEVPELPKPYDPVYSEWVAILNQYPISSDSILVGHSCGGGFLLRYFSEHPDFFPKKIILVAPWLDLLKEFSTNFFEFEVDTSLSDRTELHVFMSQDDQIAIDSCLKIKESIPGAIYHEYKDRGHFEEKEFPELLALLN